jgi:phosphoribosylformylglycinamidine cyclo-ligase
VPGHATYQAAGVDSAAEETALGQVLGHLERTLAFRRGGLGAVVLPNGFFANVLDLGNGRGLAISTDGVGSKVLIAQELGKYDTIGIDCVAMNVNDVLCVGAEPLSMVDYLAVEVLDPAIIGEIAKGLAVGAELANISIPGGEMAQLPETVRGSRPGLGLDLVGTCVGEVALERLIVGNAIVAGDVIVGLRSTGIHSNGLTLARKVLFGDSRHGPQQYSDVLGAKVGEVLLEPTRIYVREVLEMLNAELAIKALIHITSDGFLNLARIRQPIGYVIDRLPAPQAIFGLIQELGDVPQPEMFKTFNMGTGFCVIVAEADVEAVRAIATHHGVDSDVLGYTVPDPQRRVWIAEHDLIGENKEFRQEMQNSLPSTSSSTVH